MTVEEIIIDLDNRENLQIDWSFGILFALSLIVSRQFLPENVLVQPLGISLCFAKEISRELFDFTGYLTYLFLTM